MFCPTGPATSIVATSGSLSFSGINRNNPVLRVDHNGLGQADLTFQGSGGPLVAFSIYAAGEAFFHIPAAASSLDITVSGNSNAAASFVVGEDV